MFDGQRFLTKQNFTATVLTPQAAQGIFRYFPSADNANANSNDPTVDRQGNPVTPSKATGPVAAIGLLAIGAFMSILTGRSAARSGLRMLLIGAIAAGITFGVDLALHCFALGARSGNGGRVSFFGGFSASCFMAI